MKNPSGSCAKNAAVSPRPGFQPSRAAHSVTVRQSSGVAVETTSCPGVTFSIAAPSWKGWPLC
ncbi:hypothetical protein SMD44_07558 [Streptomyces alboflavus]|uniref:Uncharacterized protein n=1 Tax=Streptomyces alboflavus TaxID=67267 RepID=A0A1Z1WNQ1_9ACTN|nr:hypothetical protein SMD44_07558 [Streptomyces alboflavus]